MKYSNRIFTLLFSIISLVFLCSCKSAKVDSSIDISQAANELKNTEYYKKMDGSTACLPLATLVMQRMTGCDKETAAATLNFSTTTGAVSNLEGKDMRAGGFLPPEEITKDIALMYESADLLSSNLLEYHTIGADGLVFLVNKNNPVESITTEQIRDIYAGKITNWQEVGGEDKEIAVFNRDAASGSGVMMDKLVMQGTPYSDYARQYIINTMEGLITEMAEYNGEDNAIGYSVYYYIQNMNNNPDLKLLNINGIEPSNSTIANGEYPLTNDFYVVIRKEAPENSAARVLMNWMLSDEGKQTVIDAGYAGK